MRKIKFRGRTCDNKFKYGSLINVNNEYYIEDKEDESIEYTENYEKYINISNKVEEKIIGQYTGFKDIDGVEIYEGDIIRTKKFKEDIYGITDNKRLQNESDFIVYFDEKNGHLSKGVIDKKAKDIIPFGVLFIHQYEYVKVIGNIFEI